MWGRGNMKTETWLATWDETLWNFPSLPNYLDNQQLEPIQRQKKLAYDCHCNQNQTKNLQPIGLMVTVRGVAISRDNFRMKNCVMQKIIFLVNPLTQVWICSLESHQKRRNSQYWSHKWLEDLFTLLQLASVRQLETDDSLKQWDLSVTWLSCWFGFASSLICLQFVDKADFVKGNYCSLWQ